MRVLVTGHDGYIGSVLWRLLEREGHDVVGLDSFYFEACTFGLHFGGPQMIRRDLRDVTAGDLKGLDAICHLAALSNDPLGSLSPQWTYEINHLGSLRLAHLAKEAGVERFVFSSSCSMYGCAGGDRPVTEDTAQQPLTPYADSKVRLERDLRGLADATFSPTCLRNATAYGVSPKLRADVVLNNLTAWAYTTGQVKLLSDGSAWRPLVHVEDICRTFAAVLAAPREWVQNQAFNVGSDDQNYRVAELAEIVQHVVPGSRVERAKGSGADARSYRVSFQKLARTFPHLEFRWDVQQGARQLYHAFCSHHLTTDQVNDGRYIRICELQRLLNAGRLDRDLRWKTAASGPPLVDVPNAWAIVVRS
jgi:nucleoside-diphosphate-sugar epimerase